MTVVSAALRRSLVWWRAAVAEGPLGVRDRLRDRRAEAAVRRRFRLLGADAALPSVPVLTVLARPPAARFGGVQVQLIARRAARPPDEPFALLYPERGCWRLEVEAAGEALAVDLGAGGPLAPELVRDEAFAAALARAVSRTSARLVHLDGAWGLPFADLVDLARRPDAPGLVVSLLDFSLHCPRPDLLQRPGGRFCGGCRDLTVCDACLRVDGRGDGALVGERRQLAAELLARSAAVTYTSEALRSLVHAVLPAACRERIIPCASGAIEPSAPRRRQVVRHVAFVGRVGPGKGGALFLEIVRHLREAGSRLPLSAFGGGDPTLLRALRRLGVRTRGTYARGTLPGRLVTAGVDLGLVLSEWPEAYCMVVDECAFAGVPVVALAHGAPRERVPALGGHLLPAEVDGETAARALRTIVAAGAAPPPAAAVAALPRAATVATSFAGLFGELLGGGRPAGSPLRAG